MLVYSFELLDEADLITKVNKKKVNKKKPNKTKCEDGCCEPRSISKWLYDYARGTEA